MKRRELITIFGVFLGASTFLFSNCAKKSEIKQIEKVRKESEDEQEKTK